jgi:hypothetical protein
VSPQRRSSQFPGSPDPGRSAGAEVAPPNALFAEMLRAARELLAVRSPLDAELMVSELLGTWWGQRGTRTGGRRTATVEQLVGEGLVDYAAAQRSPAALALLSGIACLGTPRQAAKAERAALDLISSGVPCPGWAEHLGAVRPAECYLNPDVLGDQDEVVCVFSYDGQESHALVTVVDYNTDGMIRDGWVTSQVDKLLEHCRDVSAQRGAEGRHAFRQLEAGQARHMLETALTATDEAAEPPVSKSFPSYHAFIRARVRALPPYRGRPVSGATGPRRQAWSRDRRATLAAEFLASDEAEDLSDRGSASHCADRIIDYGCDRDHGRPLRMSPAKVETFLLGWLPRKAMLSYAEQDAMPHVLAAWVRWAGRRRGLADAVVAPGGVGRHIERHAILADRLWRGDPPELWEAAQRLLDAGQDRHLVLHALMAVLDHTSGDDAALIAVLRELDGDEP